MRGDGDLAPSVFERIQALLSEAEAGLRMPAPADGPDERVHAARLAIKKARAGLRVLRSALGKEEFERRDEILHAAGRALSAVRDADVLAQTAGEFSDDPAGRAAAQALARRASRVEPRTHAVERARALLVAARSHPEPHGLTRGMFARAVRRDYKRAKARLAKAQDGGRDAAFHAWRRAAKALRYELAYVEDLPKDLKKLDDALKQLGHDLGRDHDEAVLAWTLAHGRRAFGAKSARRRLVGRARRAQNAARARALRLARRAFGARPKTVGRRVRKALPH